MKVLIISILFFSAASCADFSPPKPVEIVTPRIVTEEVKDEYPYFMVTFKNDHTVWYNTVASESDSVDKKIDPPVKEKLKAAIADYKKDCEKTGKKITCLLKGDNLAKYEDFKPVLEAFKENEIYKFKMVTMLEQLPVAQPIKKDTIRKGRNS